MDALAQVQEWLDEAVAAGVYEANAMSVATSGPSVRTVLLKGVDHGLVFFTNYQSRKGREIEADPRCAASLTWPSMGRQIRVVGTASKTSAEESDEYFATRPRGSQIAAWASPQSTVLSSRHELETRVADVEARFDGIDVPRPEHWGGFRIVPSEVEFWSRRDNRLHDRLLYRRGDGGDDHDGSGDGWAVDRLAP